MKLTIPYSFVSIADPYWFLADLYTVRDFYNGLIDDYNVKEFNITTAKLKDGEIKGHHFEDLAATNAKFKSVGHNPATADKIQQTIIGPFDMRADTGGDEAENVKGLWTPGDNEHKIKIYNGITPDIELDTTENYMFSAHLWADILQGGAPEFTIAPQWIFCRIFTDNLDDITRTFCAHPWFISKSIIHFIIHCYPITPNVLPSATIKIGVEIWENGIDIGEL